MKGDCLTVPQPGLLLEGACTLGLNLKSCLPGSTQPEANLMVGYPACCSLRKVPAAGSSWPSLHPTLFLLSCPAGSPLRSPGPSSAPAMTPQPDLQGCPLPFRSAIPDKETRNRFALSPLHISPRSLRVPTSWAMSCPSLCLPQAAGHQPKDCGVRGLERPQPLGGGPVPVVAEVAQAPALRT